MGRPQENSVPSGDDKRSPTLSTYERYSHNPLTRARYSFCRWRNQGSEVQSLA